MAKHNYRVSLEDATDPADIVNALEGAGFGVIEVAVSGWNEKRAMRSESVLSIVTREAHKPVDQAVMSRNDIATEAGVSLAMATGTIKDNASIPDVAAYIQRGKADRAVEKARAAAAAAVAHAESLAASRAAVPENVGTEASPVFISA